MAKNDGQKTVVNNFPPYCLKFSGHKAAKNYYKYFSFLYIKTDNK